MKLIPHVRNAVGRWLTVKDNAAARLEGANAKNMALKYVAPFAQANLNAHIKLLYHP